MRSFSRILLAAAMLAAPVAAHAEQYLTVGGGWFNFNRDTKNSADFMAEYRGNPFFYGLLPVAGVQVNTDGGVLGYAGFDYDWEVIPHVHLIPGLDVSAWSHGNSQDLGGTFEFHESFEADYQFDNAYRVGAQIAHTSNAHLYDHNPGANTLLATFSVPFGN